MRSRTPRRGLRIVAATMGIRAMPAAGTTGPRCDRPTSTAPMAAMPSNPGTAHSSTARGLGAANRFTRRALPDLRQRGDEAHAQEALDVAPIVERVVEVVHDEGPGEPQHDSQR